MKEKAVAKRGRGRPPGSVSQRTKAIRDITNKAIEDGVTPIEVMLDNMRFYHEKADVLMTACIAGIKDQKKKPIELLEILKDMGSFRDKAQSCAADAAPYVHPRLSATHADVNVNVKVEEAEQAFKTIENVLNQSVYGEDEPAKSKPKSKVKVAA